MDNLSQNNETLLNQTENEQNENRTNLIPYTYNKFNVIGVIETDLNKRLVRKVITCLFTLRISGNTFVKLLAFGKHAEEVATIYKKGDMVAFEGQFLSKIDKENNLKVFMVIKNHMLIKKNLQVQSIQEHEYHFKETEQLYDPYKVKKRMIEGEEDKK